MSIFTSFFLPRRAASTDLGDTDDAGLTLPRKMNLEERMAYRREMLFEAISLAMDRQGIAENCYHLRVSRTDKRGHTFIVMIDLSNDFLHNARGKPASLQEIGRTITAVAGASGLLEVSGVYWSVVDATGEAGPSAHPAVDAPVTGPQPYAAPLARYQRIYASDLAPLGSSGPSAVKPDRRA